MSAAVVRSRTVTHINCEYFKASKQVSFVLFCLFPQTGLKHVFLLALFSTRHEKWLVAHVPQNSRRQSGLKKRYLGRVSGFVSTSAEIDRRGCQNELFVMTMKIPVKAHHICVPSSPEIILSAVSEPVLFNNLTAY